MVVPGYAPSLEWCDPVTSENEPDDVPSLVSDDSDDDLEIKFEGDLPQMDPIPHLDSLANYRTTTHHLDVTKDYGAMPYIKRLHGGMPDIKGLLQGLL